MRPAMPSELSVPRALDGDGDDDRRERESDGEGAGVEIAPGKQKADGGAAEEQGAGEEPAESGGAGGSWLGSSLAAFGEKKCEGEQCCPGTAQGLGGERRVGVRARGADGPAARSYEKQQNKGPPALCLRLAGWVQVGNSLPCSRS